MHTQDYGATASDSSFKCSQCGGDVHELVDGTCRACDATQAAWKSGGAETAGQLLRSILRDTLNIHMSAADVLEIVGEEIARLEGDSFPTWRELERIDREKRNAIRDLIDA